MIPQITEEGLSACIVWEDKWKEELDLHETCKKVNKWLDEHKPASSSIELILKDSGELVAYDGGFGFRCRTLGLSPIFKSAIMFNPPDMERAAESWINCVHGGAMCRRAKDEDVEQFYPTKDELERFLAGAGT